MKVTIVKGGGIAGVVTRTELASDALSPDEAATLREKVAESRVLETATPEKLEVASPDEPQYELTVEDEGGAHSVRLRESELHDPVRSLISFTESHPNRKEAIQPASF